MKYFLAFLFSLVVFSLFAQPDRWQQKVHYQMDINMNVETNRFSGAQKLTYWNNSPDTLTRLFYHLYFNAFQPGSMMDVNSLQHGEFADWDRRVMDRISKLKENEIGYQKINAISISGVQQKFDVQETILIVYLSKPILPGSKTVIDMQFEAQVPIQIRRSGRDNPNTQIRYSMSQWYPKLCEYDYEGWHPTPYVGREFYGVWGDFDVNITIDKNYIIGGTGYLQNANQIGYGYEDEKIKVARPVGKTLTWKFNAPNVHDFAWIADPKLIHKKVKTSEGVTLHLLYNTSDGKIDAGWDNILINAQKALPFIEKNFGKYGYKQYSFLEGGDGGMEYPMATLLASPDAWIHEWMHSWYHCMLATNESLYAWMDEGFTTFAENKVTAFLKNDFKDFNKSEYGGYLSLVKRNIEEPLSTHADHFHSNMSYSVSSYSKGAIFLGQLGYIVGEKMRDDILLEYYNQWKFKHPNASDFIRVAEKLSNIKLDWYKEYWIYTTKKIDYAIDSIWEEKGSTKIRLRNHGTMPMPVDVGIETKSGSYETHYVPLNLMFGTKPAEGSEPRKVYSPWPFVNRTYTIETKVKVADIKWVAIDPANRTADVNPKNNKLNLDY